MSQHLLISSAYRNRLLYPNSAKFVVPFGTINNANSNIFNVFTTTNPITNSFPNYNCSWTNYQAENIFEFETKIIGGTAQNPILDVNVNEDLLAIDKKSNDPFYLSQPLATSFDCLENFVLVVEINNLQVVRVIKKYDPIQSRLTLIDSIPFFSLKNGPLACKIVYPLALQDSEYSIVLSKYKNVVIINGPFLDSSVLTYFDYNFYLYNVNLNEIRRVTEFLPNLSAAAVETSFGPNNKITDQYFVITKNKPTSLGKIQKFPNGQFYMYFPETVQWRDRGQKYQKNKVIYFQSLQEQNRPIEYFHKAIITSTTILGEIESYEFTELGTQDFILYTDYKIVPLEEEILPSYAFMSITSFFLSFHIKFNNSYPPQLGGIIGNYFFPIVQSQQYSLSGTNSIALQPNNTIRLTAPYSQNGVNISANTPIDLLDSQTLSGVSGIRQIYKLKDNDQYLLCTQNYSSLQKLDLLAKNFDELPENFAGIDNFMTLPFTHEGVVPLNFTGSQITQTQASCYSLSIVNLILPNQILASGDGLLTSSYPYVFVNITNESNPNGGNFNKIYSNNPFSTKAMFVCSISDVNNPETTKFIKISSDGVEQPCTFSPVDNLGIEITLPNGTIFQTENSDYLVPCDANPLLQITLIVSITKISD